MNSGPQPAVAELLRQAPVASGLAREKVAQHGRRCRAEGRRVRDVAWEIGVWNYRSDGRVELVGTRRPVVKFRVLRSDPAIVVGDMHQRVGARRARGVAVQAELSQSPAHLVTQAMKHARAPVLSKLPVKNFAVRDRSALEVFHLGNLGGTLRRIGRRWRTGAKLVC